jgi:hypothetical protein
MPQVVLSTSRQLREPRNVETRQYRPSAPATIMRILRLRTFKVTPSSRLETQSHRISGLLSTSTLYPAWRSAFGVVGVRAERCSRGLHSDLRCIVVDAFTPYQRYGAGIAIEDAYVLSNILDLVFKVNGLELAFRVFDYTCRECS